MNKEGQVWVETVIYTLIALVLIGLVISFVQPEIQKLQDKSTLQQSISMLNDIDNVISSLAQNEPGNSKRVKLTLKAGSLTIDGVNDLIIFSVGKSHYQFSEPDKIVNYTGNLAVYTHTVNDLSSINMTLSYSQYNITYAGQNVVKTITPASTPYSLLISNVGGNKIQMGFQLV